MADYKDTDEDLNEYIAVFGELDGPAIQKITDTVSQLCIEWRMFLYFFCGPKERVNVLNAASGLTARVIGNALWDNALLKIRRLTDPRKAGGNTNLSLEVLREVAERRSGQDLTADYDAMIAQVQPARDYARKYLAHSDFDHALGKRSTPVRRGETTAAVRAMMEFTATFHQRVRNVTYRLMPTTTVEDEQQFLLRLHLGNLADEEAEARLLQLVRGGGAWPVDRPDIPIWVFDSAFRDDPF